MAKRVNQFRLQVRKMLSEALFQLVDQKGVSVSGIADAIGVDKMHLFRAMQQSKDLQHYIVLALQKYGGESFKPVTLAPMDGTENVSIVPKEGRKDKNRKRRNDNSGGHSRRQSKARGRSA